MGLLIPSLKSFTPTSSINWQRVETLVHGPSADIGSGGGDSNSAVFACLMTLATAYTEPPPRLLRQARDGKVETVQGSPLLKLLNAPTPNAELSLDELMFWTAWAKHTHGNAYWLKIRSGHAERGNVVELWPVSPVAMKPVTKSDARGRSEDWISHYKMNIAANEWVEVAVENVIHFRLGLDPRDMRLGLSPLKRLVRQIASDEEADKFTNTLLQNYAIPGLVVIPGQGEEIDAATASRISEAMTEKFGGSNRGKTAVISRHSDVRQFGFSPKDMDMGTLHQIPEERIAAVIGVPAILAGLGAGLARGTYANARELRELFTEQKLVPEWRSNAARLSVSLLPDFSSDPSLRLDFDTSGVRALQEDENERYARLNLGVGGVRQWITINEARADVGLPPIDGGDVLQDSTATASPPAVPPPGEEAKVFARKQTTVRQLVETRTRLRERVAKEAETAVDGWFAKIADAVVARVMGEGKAITERDWDKVLSLLFDQSGGELQQILKRYSLAIVELSWPLWNVELESEAQFTQNDPAVQAALEGAGKRVKGILEATRQELVAHLREAYFEGQPVEEIADGVRQLITETYANRGEAIARTEIGTAQNVATHSRYRQAGVQHVRVFDNGFDNSHPFCRRINGKVVTLEWAERNPLQHPNCVRAFGAVFDYEGDVFTEEARWQ